jgi:hypothetical protein
MKYRAVCGAAWTALTCGTALAFPAKPLSLGTQLLAVIKVRSTLYRFHEMYWIVYAAVTAP